MGNMPREEEGRTGWRKGNSHQTSQGSAVASPCLLTGTAKHGPAEKAGCPSGTADGSESEKEACANASSQQLPGGFVPAQPLCWAWQALSEHIRKGRKEDFPTIATGRSNDWGKGWLQLTVLPPGDGRVLTSPSPVTVQVFLRSTTNSESVSPFSESKWNNTSWRRPIGCHQEGSAQCGAQL